MNVSQCPRQTYLKNKNYERVKTHQLQGSRFLVPFATAIPCIEMEWIVSPPPCVNQRNSVAPIIAFVSIRRGVVEMSTTVKNAPTLTSNFPWASASSWQWLAGATARRHQLDTGRHRLRDVRKGAVCGTACTTPAHNMHCTTNILKAWFYALKQAYCFIRITVNTHNNPGVDPFSLAFILTLIFYYHQLS